MNAVVPASLVRGMMAKMFKKTLAKPQPRVNVSDHFKPATDYRNDPATKVRVSRHFSSKQARYKLLLSSLFERKMPLSLKHLT
jgi:hypothetical protein